MVQIWLKKGDSQYMQKAKSFRGIDFVETNFNCVDDVITA